MSAASRRKLTRLVARRDAAAAKLAALDRELIEAVQTVRAEEGVSVRGVAETLGVGASTVQDWARAARAA
jgi:DNA-binding transcriptional regulator YiaG